MKHKRKDLLAVSFRADRHEQQIIELIMKKRKLNSYSQVMRVIVNEAGEKILNSDLSSDVANQCSTTT